jgi:predicted HTH domain antitoxin
VVTVTVELPAELAAQLDPQNISIDAARIITLELFRERKISLGRASQLYSMPMAAFMDFAMARGVSPLSYDLENMEADFRTIEKPGL